MKQTLVLGGAGAGKTTRLLGVMEAALQRGVPPNQIAFTTFTRAAAGEAKTRAMERFGFSSDDLPYFRTLHSLAFNQLGVRRSDVVSSEHLAELSEITGELTTSSGSIEGPATRRQADALLTVDHYARTTRQDLREAWNDHGGDLDWFRLKRFSDAYRLYKTDRGMLDFTDMLADYVKADMAPVPVQVAIIDEGQDLTLLQWAVAERAFSAASELWVAGDDWQEVHKWAGAAADYFLGLEDAGYTREVLPLSHRLPREIFDFSQNLISRLSRGYAKNWRSADRSGVVEWVSRPEEVDLSHGTWLLLTRTRAQMSDMVDTARGQGVAYEVKGRSSIDPKHVVAIQGYEALRAGKRIEGSEAIGALQAAGLPTGAVVEGRTYTARELAVDVRPIWHDALVRIPLDDREYYLACMRRGAKLTEAPRVRIDTIHGSKGLEAEHVLLTTDLTWQTNRGYELDPDSEHRVFYVGVTRASQSLHLVAPQTAYGYPL